MVDIVPQAVSTGSGVSLDGGAPGVLSSGAREGPRARPQRSQRSGSGKPDLSRQVLRDRPKRRPVSDDRTGASPIAGSPSVSLPVAPAC